MCNVLFNIQKVFNRCKKVLFASVYFKFLINKNRFPENVDLRISFVFFLFEKLNYKEQALNELLNAEKYSPSFENQFVIYRYKFIFEISELIILKKRRIIEEDITNNRNENSGIDGFSELLFKNNFKIMESNIEKIALLQLEFWSELIENHPGIFGLYLLIILFKDFATIHKLGTKITKCDNILNNSFNKLQKISPNLPSVLRIYGKYISEIKNDKEKGENYLEE